MVNLNTKSSKIETIDTPKLKLSENSKFHHYLNYILETSEKYLNEIFTPSEFKLFSKKINYIYNLRDTRDIVDSFSAEYYSFVKQSYQKTYKHDPTIDKFTNAKESKKIIWGDSLKALRLMKNESIHCMVTSPPYYNARKYAHWTNLNDYLKNMKEIVTECYRVLDNHRVFVFNVGDIFDNDNLYTESVWGKRRLPLGAYFIQLFEEVGFTFVDDIIWDKVEVQSERHKNGNRPYPFYQYPMNCYEHILIFHKHRVDLTRYPCPVCGTLNVNGNAYSERGLKSWECKNKNCFTRSKSNRGKRFSAKTFNTQSPSKNSGAEIPDNFIYSWRRDIKKINPVIKINSQGKNILGHTAPFPQEIPEYAIRMFSYVGENILDPFSGLGTSIKVASKLNRIGIGLERDLTIKEYVYKFIGIDDFKELFIE